MSKVCVAVKDSSKCRPCGRQAALQQKEREHAQDRQPFFKNLLWPLPLQMQPTNTDGLLHTGTLADKKESCSDLALPSIPSDKWKALSTGVDAPIRHIEDAFEM